MRRGAGSFTKLAGLTKSIYGFPTIDSRNILGNILILEFLLIAIIDGQTPMIVGRYDGPTAMNCMKDASKLNEYVSAGYMEVSDDARFNIEKTREQVEKYQSQFGKLEGFSEKVFDLNTKEANDFTVSMKEQMQPVTIAMNMRDLPREQADLLMYIAVHYTSFVEWVAKDEKHSLFQDFINSKLLDEATMYTRNELNYRCLPTVKK